MRKSSKTEQKTIKTRPPATTPEGRENQLIALAVDLVEQRMLNGTASAQEVTHFLKLGSSLAKLEKKLLEKQVELTNAKTESIQSAKRQEELFTEAIKAMKRYTGEVHENENYE